MKALLLVLIAATACGRAPNETTCASMLVYQTRIEVLGGLDRVLYVGSSVGCPVTQWSGILLLRLQVAAPPSPGLVESLSAGADRHLDLSLPLSHGSTAADRKLQGLWRLPWQDAETLFELAVHLPSSSEAVPTEVSLTLAEDDSP